MTRDDFLKELAEYNWGPIAFDIGVRADFYCEYCGLDLLESVNSFDSWQTDHILPGKFPECEEFWNLALSCKTCNFLKRNSRPGIPINPKEDRAQAIGAIREIIDQRRARKQAQVNRLRELFRDSEEWRVLRGTILTEIMRERVGVANGS